MPKVIYNGNGNTGGSVPVDGNNYNVGDKVTILGPGSLAKGSDQFAYWNTVANGTGTVRGQGATFTIGASDVTLFALWYTTTGLTNGGATPKYQFAYDSVLATAAFGNIEPARTNSILANASNGVPIVDNDFTWMQQQFAGVDITKTVTTLPIPVYVSSPNGGGYGASWWPLVLGPGNRPASLLRTLMVAEVVEMFMGAQDKGWGYSSGVGNEESSGEALSLFLAVQFQLNSGLGISWLSNGTPATWLNTSLPASNPSSTEFDGTTHYGSRKDYVNSTLPFAGNGPGTGCSLALIYYLFHQFGFSSIPQIIAAAPGVELVSERATPVSYK